jgi:hypothetical protein
MMQESSSSRLAARKVFLLFACWFVISLALPDHAAAQALCKCAARPLTDRMCENELTAQVKVLETSCLKNGNMLYRARVKAVFRGQAEHEILIEAPKDCGIKLSNRKTYVVSLNSNEQGHYTTFACGSFVSLWSELSDEDYDALMEPACVTQRSCENTICPADEACIMQQIECFAAPCNPIPSCVPHVASENELCYRFWETDATMSVERTCGENLKCTATGEGAGFNTQKYCKAKNYCVSEDSAASDCASQKHIMMLGRWGCEAHACTFRTGKL